MPSPAHVTSRPATKGPIKRVKVLIDELMPIALANCSSSSSISTKNVCLVGKSKAVITPRNALNTDELKAGDI